MRPPIPELLFAFAFCLTAGCSHETSKTPTQAETSPKADRNNPWDTNDFYSPTLSANKPIRSQLGEDHLRALKSQALLGDAASARIVFLYLSEKADDVATTSLTKDTEIERWTSVAVENGDAMVASMLANRFAKTPTMDNCRRAVFWYKRAMSAEPSFRANIEDALDQLAANWPACEAGG